MKKALVITLLTAALTVPPAAPSYTVEAFVRELRTEN